VNVHTTKIPTVALQELFGDFIAALGHPDLQTSHHPTSFGGNFSKKNLFDKHTELGGN
jgi:hypothetical protein